MSTKELTLHVGETVVHVEIRVATLRDSLLAADLADKAMKNPDPIPGIQAMRQFFYPVMATVTKCTDGELPTVEQFLDMPANDANAWYQAVLDLNPGTMPTVEGLVPGGETSGESPEEKKE